MTRSDLSLRPSRLVKVLRWFVVVVLTLATLWYQRSTGPTYPISVNEELRGSKVSGKLIRTHAGAGGAVIELTVADQSAEGEVVWRRYPTSDAYETLPMTRSGDKLSAELPPMPTAGKLEYTVQIGKGSSAVTLPSDGNAIIRYRQDVPAWVLIPHIVCMFASLLVALRLLMAAALNEPSSMKLFPWLMTLLLVGGLVLGPLVQKYAFDAYWTGWPVGEDLTDTKTLVAFVAWGLAWWACVKTPQYWRIAVTSAAAVMMVVYLIPHSVRGSQYDWSKSTAPVTSAGERRQ